MSASKKLVTDSLLKKACEQNKMDTVADADKEKAFAAIDDILDKSIDKKTPSDIERKKVYNKKNKRKGITQTIAVVACAAICALGISGGAVTYFNSMTESTATDTRANSMGEENSNTVHPEIIEDESANPTERAVEFYKENDISNVKEGKISLSGGKKGTNYTNPTKAVLKNAKIKNGTCTWTISDYETNKAVYKGKGTTVTSQLTKMIKQKQDGRYLIAFTYKDKDGNKFTIYEGFAVNTETETETEKQAEQ